jgi:hypothetical protein
MESKFGTINIPLTTHVYKEMCFIGTIAFWSVVLLGFLILYISPNGKQWLSSQVGKQGSHKIIIENYQNNQTSDTIVLIHK